MQFVIIGGDAAGMSAASRAKRNDSEIDVTVLEQTDDVSYSACGMPYNIADPHRSIDDLVVRRAEVFREKQGINLLTGHCAERIEPGERIVTGTDRAGNPFRLSYDKLLIASGASPIVPDVPGMNLPGVLVLKSLEHGRRIKAFIGQQGVQSAVIIGMGYIALEMCEALRARGIGVEMVKPRPGLLPWMAADLSGVVREELEKNDVGVHDGYEVERIRRDGAKAGLRRMPPSRGFRRFSIMT
jgi:NADPH-dependent 2,4-dienoyl-CoA reductase/sulfur reductase-like enzyme